MEQLLKVGIISSTHGVRGQVKVFPTTDDIRRFDRLKQVILRETNGQERTLSVEAVQYFKQLVIVKFAEFGSLNEVETLRGAGLYVTRADAVPLAADEYFIADLIGLSVVTDEGKSLGCVTDVLQTGANDVYVVEDADKKEYYIPAIRECVRQIDLTGRTITVHLLDGLLDL